MSTKDPRVDAYIAKSAPFARPILAHLRAVVHAAAPSIHEEIKWGMPSFCHNGRIVCGMAAFKAHATFGFWRGALVLGRGGGQGAMGIYGRLTSVADLPSKRELVASIRKAVALADGAIAAPKRARRAPKALPKTPPALAAALRADAEARSNWEKFSTGMRREYIVWIVEAKRSETRERRIAQTVAQLREGKSQNWKYATKRGR